MVSLPCGYRAVPVGERLIIGGLDAKLGEFPHQLSVRKLGLHSCGASLIEPGKVLTSARCVADIPRIWLTVLAGTIYSAALPSTAQTRRVNKIIVHPNYNKDTFENDIAVLFVSSDFELGLNVNTVRICTTTISTGFSGTVTGWGARVEGGLGTLVLRKATVPFVSDENCRADYSVESIKDSMLCAGYDEGGDDACQGDTGGPLILQESGQLVGIVSWGKGCGRPNKPHVYTQVSYFAGWINAQNA